MDFLADQTVVIAGLIKRLGEAGHFRVNFFEPECAAGLRIAAGHQDSTTRHTDRDVHEATVEANAFSGKSVDVWSDILD